MTSTQDLGWLLANFADRVPGVAHAVAVSADGLLLAASRDLPATGPTSLPRSPPAW
jgi:predicted regulator of Ras-like GTPase activity (Roadblock/LC7/MglB family)